MFKLLKLCDDSVLSLAYTNFAAEQFHKPNKQYAKCEKETKIVVRIW